MKVLVLGTDDDCSGGKVKDDVDGGAGGCKGRVRR